MSAITGSIPNSNNVELNRMGKRINYIREKATLRLEELVGKKDQASMNESRNIGQFLKDIQAKWDIYTSTYKEFQTLTWKLFGKDNEIYQSAFKAIA